MKRSLLYLFAILAAFLASENACAQSRNTEILLSEAGQFAFEAPGKALKLADYAIKHGVEPETAVKANLIKSQAYSALSQYDLAMEHAFISSEAALEIGEKLAFETQLFTLHLFYMLQVPAQPTYFPALKHLADPEFRAQLSPNLELAATMVLGREQMISGDTTSAMSSFEKAETLMSALAEPNYAFGDPLIEIALLQSARNLNEAALESFKSALPRHQKYPEGSVYTGRVLLNIGVLESQSGNYALGLAEIEEAKAIAIALDHSELLTEISFALIDIYAREGVIPRTQDAVDELYTASSKVEGIKNAAMNAGHSGMSSFLDKQRFLVRDGQKTILNFGLGMLGFIILAAFAILFANRVQASNLSDIIKYLESSKRAMGSKESTAIESPSNRSSSVSKSTEEQIVLKLQDFEKGEKYLSQDMSLAKLASILDTNTKYLSEVINQQKGKNFNTYINELRVSYIIEKLKTNPTYLNYKVSYLAQECGFSSHSSFTTVFKSISGISPAKFIALIQLEKQNKLEPQLK